MRYARGPYTGGSVTAALTAMTSATGAVASTILSNSAAPASWMSR
jgi:hypothetical protein